MSQAPNSKTMTIGESGLSLVFAVTAFLCTIGAAKALDAPFAFHASLFAAASLASVFVTLNRYYDRPAELPPQEINGRPNYNMGPVKFSSVMAMFWGIAGFTVGLIIASQLAWPARNFVLRRSEDLPGPSGRRSRAVVCRHRLQLLHPDRRHRLSARGDAVEGICRAGMVFGLVADHRLGGLSAGFPDDDHQAQGAA